MIVSRNVSFQTVDMDVFRHLAGLISFVNTVICSVLMNDEGNLCFVKLNSSFFFFFYNDLNEMFLF